MKFPTEWKVKKIMFQTTNQQCNMFDHIQSCRRVCEEHSICGTSLMESVVCGSALPPLKSPWKPKMPSGSNGKASSSLMFKGSIQCSFLETCSAYASAFGEALKTEMTVPNSKGLPCSGTIWMVSIDSCEITLIFTLMR